MALHQVFYYLTLVLLPTQLGYHVWPEWALVLGRRLDYLSPTVFLTDITIVLTLICWLLSKRTNIYIRQSAMNKKYIALFILLLMFATANIGFSIIPVISLIKWLKVLELGLFGVYIVQTKPSYSRSIGCLSFAVFYSSILALIQFSLQHSVGGIFWLLGERSFSTSTPGIATIQILISPMFTTSFFGLSSQELLRPYATFPHPNVLGGFLAIGIPLIIDQHIFQKNQINSFVTQSKKIFAHKIFIRSTIFLGILALICTFSRTSWVLFIFLLFILFIKRHSLQIKLFFRTLWNRATRESVKQMKTYNNNNSNSNGHRVSPLQYFQSMLKQYWVIVLFPLLILFSLPYYQTLSSTHESVFVRHELNVAAVSMWWQSPPSASPYVTIIHRLCGIGLNTYLIELPKIYPHRDIFFLQPVHNIYLLLLSETGIVGLLMFLSLLCVVLRRKNLTSLDYALIILLLIGLVDHYPLTLQQGQLLFTVILSMAFIRAR